MITDVMVKAWLRLDPTDTTDDDLISQVVDATNAWVAGSAYMIDRGLGPAPWPAQWPEDVTQGAVMLAARLYRRRNTPGGIESMADAAVYVPRRDSDVDRLLHMGAWAPPRAG